MAEYRTHTALAGPRCWRIWFLALPVWTAVVLAQAPPAKVPTKEDEDLKALLPRLKPLEPAEALRSFRIEKGFRIELAAAEPGVTDPIAAAFDENGRLYVAEMGDYPNAPKEGERPFGRVRLLEDTNGDGRFDKSTVFAEGLPAPSGIACWQGGVFVAAAPDIWYFKDTDGDGKADIAQKVYTGFGTGKHTYPVLNNLHWGLDNKIYGVSSYAGGTISRVEKPGPTVSVRRQGFRFNPVSGAFEAVPGNAEFGNTFDDWGNRFVCHATVMVFHCLLPGPYWEHNPHVPAMTATQPLTANFAPVFPISKPEPWKVARERFWKRWVNTTPDMRAGRFPPSELAPSGFTTASSGVTIYRGAAFPPAYRGNAFTGEPANNLVCRHILEPAGVGFRARRAGDKQEFLASSDNWFRPVNFLNGPDGCLYVLDMYREVIEDDSAIPDDILRHLDLTSGRDRGRIYRIVPEGFQRPPQPRLGREDTRALVALLDRPDAWWRETAQRLLVERRDPAVVEPLRALARTAARSEARLHALWTLEGLGALDEETLLGALEASEARLREHGLRLAESRLNDAQRLRDQVLARATDAAPRVRFQTALTLAGAKDPRAAEALATIARRDADEPASRLAVLIGSSNHAGALFAALASDEPFLRRSAGLELLKQLAQGPTYDCPGPQPGGRPAPGQEPAARRAGQTDRDPALCRRRTSSAPPARGGDCRRGPAVRRAPCGSHWSTCSWDL
jgi:putative membrane-bound dehydrogenase-like protein